MAGAVGPRQRLDLDHLRPRRGQELPAQRPGPQRGQVDHRAPSMGRAGAPAASCRHAASIGRPMAGPAEAAVAEVTGGPTEPSAAMGRPSSAALSSSAAASDSARDPLHTGQGSSTGTSTPSQAPSAAMSSGRARETASQLSAVRTRRVLPPQLVVPRRVRFPRAARSPSRASPSTATRPLAAAVHHPRCQFDQVDQRPVGRPGRDRPACRSAPWRRSPPTPCPCRSTARSCHRRGGAAATVSGMVAASAFSRHPTASWRHWCPRLSPPRRSRIRAAWWWSPPPTTRPATPGRWTV